MFFAGFDINEFKKLDQSPKNQQNSPYIEEKCSTLEQPTKLLIFKP